VEAAKDPVRHLPGSVDRKLFMTIHGLPHSPISDRYGSMLSDVGEGLGWVVAGAGLAWIGGERGRRAGIATALASLSATYLVQRLVKPVFRRKRPFVDREVLVVGVKPLDASFPSGHTASSFAGAAAITAFYPAAAPLVFTLASAVGVSRVYLGHHFPSDVAVGAATGTGIGALIGWALRSTRLLHGAPPPA
jgi:undecaprenyl-diphosphatase